MLMKNKYNSRLTARCHCILVHNELFYLDPLSDLVGGLLYLLVDSLGNKGTGTAQPQA